MISLLGKFKNKFLIEVSYFQQRSCLQMLMERSKIIFYFILISDRQIFGVIFQNQHNIQIIKYNTQPMSTTDLLAKRHKLQPIKLSIFSCKRPFRIRSVSKEKLQDNNRVAAKKNNESQKLFMSNGKYRSSSLKSTKSKKTITRKSQVNNVSSDEEVLQARSCNNSKIQRLSSKEALQIQHKKNIRKLFQIATIFDPQRIMKLKRKNTQHSHQQGRRPAKAKNLKSQFRLNQYIFQGSHNRHKKDHNLDLGDADEYWKKVNESLILPPDKNGEAEISKDLRQIFEALATQ